MRLLSSVCLLGLWLSGAIGGVACSPASQTPATAAASPASPPPPTATPAPEPSGVAAAGPETAPSGNTPAAPAAPPAKLTFIDDDFQAALAQAQAQDKLLFIDAWAEWCHTCKSMKSYVFSDPALLPLAGQVVFAALDTDQPQNAEFLEQYEVKVWPSLFAIDPGSKTLIGYWPGSASLEELREFLQTSIDAREALVANRLDPQSPRALLIRAKQAQLQDKPHEAVSFYQRALATAPPQWSHLSEALQGGLWGLAQARRTAECVTFGVRHLGDVEGTLAGFYASVLLSCARHQPALAQKTRARAEVIAKLEALLAEPPSGMSADDAADTWGTLAEAHQAEGQKQAAQAARARRLEVLEQAAASAPSPQAASTFDAARAYAYLDLGRGEQAVALLRGRMQELPDSYEPPGRLASILEQLGRPREALTALKAALERAYGPRRLGYLAQQARLLGALGEHAQQVEALEQEVAGYRSLRGGHANAAKLKSAEQRLAQARQRLQP